MTAALLFALAMATPAAAGTWRLLEGDSLEISVGQYRTVLFTLPPERSEEARMLCSLSVRPETAMVEVLLMHQDDWMRWRADAGEVDTLAAARAGSGPLQLPLSGFGDMALVVSNRGNFDPVQVTLSARILHEGTGDTGDPLPSALRIALLLMMMGVIAVAVGALVARWRGSARRRA